MVSASFLSNLYFQVTKVLGESNLYRDRQRLSIVHCSYYVHFVESTCIFRAESHAISNAKPKFLPALDVLLCGLQILISFLLSFFLAIFLLSLFSSFSLCMNV